MMKRGSFFNESSHKESNYFTNQGDCVNPKARMMQAKLNS